MKEQPNRVDFLPNDVSRCAGLTCKIKLSCRRHIAWRNGNVFVNSSVTNFQPNADGTCANQIPRQ